jgi:transcriptional regulator with XRE-family HTH domain
MVNMIKLKELRIAKNYSQNELAQMVGCNQTAIGKYERGQLEPNIETLKKFSSIFETSIDYIVENADDFENVVIKTPATVPGLSAQEKELLEYFEKLGPFERDSILVQVKALAGRVKETLPK